MMQAGRPTPLPLILLGSLLLAGCKSNELVENELRARDTQYREALEELGRVEARNQALERELEATRQGAKLTPQQAAQIGGVRRIVLGRLTGGYDNDGLPGDEALQVIIEPRDGADRSVQSLGEASITALEIDPRGVKTPIGTWTVGADQLKKSWKQGLLSTGYSLILPWKTLPRVETVRVVVRVTFAGGGVYEADRDVKVRVVPGAAGQALPPSVNPDEDGPALEPVRKQTFPNVPVGQWYVPPLGDAIQLGRPVPHFAPQTIFPYDE